MAVFERKRFRKLLTQPSPIKAIMKNPRSSVFSPKALALLVAVGSLAGAVSTTAQTVFLSFTGGGAEEAPLTITWNAPIVYQLIGDASASGGAQPFFVFADVGDVYDFHQYSTIGAPTYTGIDGSAAITWIASGYAVHNDVGPNDVVTTHYPILETTQMLTGATFVLSAGTLTTNQAFSGTLPVDGYYTTFITDGSFHLLGSGTSAIPEPSTYAAIAGAAMLGLAVWRRRSTRNSPGGSLPAAA